MAAIGWVAGPVDPLTPVPGDKAIDLPELVQYVLRVPLRLLHHGLVHLLHCGNGGDASPLSLQLIRIRQWIVIVAGCSASSGPSEQVSRLFLVFIGMVLA